MVMDRFKNLDVQCWEHLGPRLGLKPPFICLQANAQTCDVLLTAIDELATEDAPAQRTLTLKTCERPRARLKIRLVLSSATDELEEMSLGLESDAAVFEFTPTGLAQFRKAVASWRNGAEDFSIHPRKRKASKDKASGEIWFWTPQMEP